jgi:thiamine biosynthesis lipoprotein
VKTSATLLLLCLLNFNAANDLHPYYLSGHAQGTTWHITYYARDAVVHQSQIDSIFAVIDSALSVYKPFSAIVAFNKSSRGIVIGDHFKNVINKSFDVWKATGGLSDITVAPLVNAWGFGAGTQQYSTPSDSLIDALHNCVGAKLVRLAGDSLIKLKPCVTIDVNGIAQGYTVDVMARFFESHLITNYIIEIGGEMRVKGTKQNKEPFRIGIESPGDANNVQLPMQQIISINSGALTTSGNYRKFHESGGKKVSHIIHPLTGKPVDNELISVTVYAADATTADGYDNALMLMGLKKAMRFVEKRKDLGVFFIYKNPDGSVADTASAIFKKLFVK